MSDSKRLRQTRKNTIINVKSKKQESALGTATEEVFSLLEKLYPHLTFKIEKKLMLKDITSVIKNLNPGMKLQLEKDSSFLKPDGGIIYIENEGKKYIVLISEAKRQGTNNERLIEGKKEQAKGNAVERLGKNVIGFRAYFSDEEIFPFVCFGEGDDFKKDSSILDRVNTISLFSINETNLYREGVFQRGSFYFREDIWSKDEIKLIILDIATKSIDYYSKKYNL